jgi:hypothetical protein
MSLKYTVPFEIVQWQNTMFKEFDKLRQDYNSSNEKIYQNNDMDMIHSFNRHPDIHPYYYDSLEDNKILVKDQFSGKLIKKDQCLLGIDGLFYYKFDPKFVTSNLNTSVINAYKDLLRGKTTEEEINKRFSKYILQLHTGDCIPFDIKYIDVQISSSNFAHCIHENLCKNFPLNKYKVETLIKDKIDNIFERCLDLAKYFTRVNKEETTYIRFKNVILAGFYDEFNHIYVPELKTWLQTHSNDRQDIVLIPFHPIFIGYIGKPSFNTKPIPKKTRNNEGIIMDFKANVCSFKTPFMMLEEEKNIYDSLTKDKDKVPPEHNPIFLGLELELIARQADAQQPNFSNLISKIAKSDFSNHCIMKHDGSLKDRVTGLNFGVEFVTVPATLAYHKKMFEDNFFNKENMFHKNFMSNEKCGIHVHISKNVLTTLQWGKLMYFLNAKENIAFMNEISNRQPTIYCARENTPNRNKHGLIVGAKMIASACVDRNIKKGLINQSLGHIDELRRKVLNTINGQTMEIRCFKSSTDKNNIFRKLEFCDALPRFVRQYSTQDMNVYNFVDFILNFTNKKQYPYLVRWLASKNYIGHTYKKIQGTMKLAHTYSTNLVTPPTKENIK